MISARKFKKFFMNIAYEASTLSKSKRLQVGAVIVNKDMRIIATGYNGLPSGYEPDVLEDDNGNTKPEVIHAEVNAILSCAKYGISCKDCMLFVTHSPCESCASLIIQSGITHVYYAEDYRISSHELFTKCNIVIEKITHSSQTKNI